MQKVKTFAFVILFGIAAIGLTPSPARAAVLLVDGGGQLTGATGVDVNGTFYDVTFVDGTCAAIFSGCDNASADFTFTDQASAELAAQALLDQVFIDDVLGLFDSSPELTFGCFANIFDSCFAQIPWSIGTSNNFAVAADNTIGVDIVLPQAIAFGTDFSTGSVGPSNVWATFTPTVIPLPPAVLLFGSGLVALFGYARVGRRRRRQV